MSLFVNAPSCLCLSLKPLSSLTCSYSSINKSSKGGKILLELITGDRGESQSWSRSLNDSLFSKVSHALFPSLLCTTSYDTRKPQVRHMILSSLLTSFFYKFWEPRSRHFPHYFGGNSTSYWGGLYFPLLSNFFWMI